MENPCQLASANARAARQQRAVAVVATIQYSPLPHGKMTATVAEAVGSCYIWASAPGHDICWESYTRRRSFPVLLAAHLETWTVQWKPGQVVGLVQIWGSPPG